MATKRHEDFVCVGFGHAKFRLVGMGAGFKPLDTSEVRTLTLTLALTLTLTLTLTLALTPTRCDDGASFRVSDPVKFAARVLPRHFKHNKLGSFQQQLLTYGFQRLPNQSCLDISSVWMHQYFRRNQHHLLDHIQRQPAKSSARSCLGLG